MLEKKDTFLALDIDQTLAGGVVAAHLAIYNRELKLGMTNTEISQAGASYPKTFDVPQIQAYRKNHEAQFQTVRSELLKSDEAALALEPIDGAQEAVHFLLSTVAHAGYFTVRPPEILEATKKWLKKHDFPIAEDTIICKDHLNKVEKVINTANSMETTPVLIDDSFRELLEAMIQTQRMSDLLLVGFGQDTPTVQGAVESKLGFKHPHVHGLKRWTMDAVRALRSSIKPLKSLK